MYWRKSAKPAEFSLRTKFVVRFPRMACAATLLILATSAAQCDEPVKWRTGAAYRRALGQQLSVDWLGNPIRSALDSLARNNQVAIFLDRRVDPGMPVRFQPEIAPLADLLKQFAARHDLGVASIGSVVYIGPTETAGKLNTLLSLRRQDLRKLSPQASRRISGSRPVRWDDLATPRQLLDEIEREYGIRVAGKDLAPHDLWPAADLPPLSFSERLTLLLAGFSLTYNVQSGGEGIQLAKIPEKMTLIRNQGNQVTKRTVTTGDKRYTLKVENQPVGPLVKLLATRLKLNIQFAESAQDKMNQIVSLNVKEVTRDELLRAALAPAGLAHRVKDGVIEVYRGSE